jgi:hypothetical protein
MLILVTGRFHLRSLKLHPDASGWLEFVKEIGAIVFIAETFGDLIQPTPLGVCCRGSPVPVGKDYLTIPMYALPIDDRHRHNDHLSGYVKLTDITYWHGFETDITKGSCAKGQKCKITSQLTQGKCNKLTSQNGDSVNIVEQFEDGALIIGGTREPKDIEPEKKSNRLRRVRFFRVWR